jgi:hypothetical protein
MSFDIKGVVVCVCALLFVLELDLWCGGGGGVAHNEVDENGWDGEE